jgi:hypothetical protein
MGTICQIQTTRAGGVGQRYLIQHSAGSGKSNSIAWLAHQFIGFRRDDANARGLGWQARCIWPPIMIYTRMTDRKFYKALRE